MDDQAERPVATGDEPAEVVRPRKRWRLLKWAVNGWLALHLAAIVIAPASVEPSSLLANTAWELVSPYLHVLYLNHGYHFFAPEPAESTLVAFTATRADGTVVTGRFPDRSMGPRLLYHRHFMLSEHMAATPDEIRELWHESFARHIGKKYGAVKVGLTQQMHLLPTLEMGQQGIRLDDPAGYVEQPLGEYTCDPS